MALRLGLRQVKSFGEGDGEKLMAARANGYPDPLSLWRRAHLHTDALEALAKADAFRSMGLDRREALWALRGLPSEPLPLFAAMAEEEQGEESPTALPRMRLGEHVAEDYKSLRLSLKAHPMALLRERIARAGYVPARRLLTRAAGKRVDVAGIVLVRQQPGTASGVIFATLEDETGVANIIIWPKVFERFRRTVLGSSLLGVRGTLQREGIVTHVVAEKLVDLSHLLRALGRYDGTSADAGSVADHVLGDDLLSADLKIAPSPPDHFKRPPTEKPRLVPDATRSLPDPSRRITRKDPSFPSRDFR